MHIVIYYGVLLLACRAACFGGHPKKPRIRELFARGKTRALALCGVALILLGEILSGLLVLSGLFIPGDSSDSMLGILNILAFNGRWAYLSRAAQEVGFYTGTLLLLAAFYFAARDQMGKPEFRQADGFEEEQSAE